MPVYHNMISEFYEVDKKYEKVSSTLVAKQLVRPDKNEVRCRNLFIRLTHYFVICNMFLRQFEKYEDANTDEVYMI